MQAPTRSEAVAHSLWPRRFAVATLVAAVPLVFFGSSVTTLHAGLAIDGWLILEPGRGDHFLWLYPVDKWFRDLGTFVEHTHRLLGSLVGLLALGTVVVTFLVDRRPLARWMSATALLAVITQGVIGGFRVLERSDGLAFLHGAIAQAVLAALAASCVAVSPAITAMQGGRTHSGNEHQSDLLGRSVRRLAIATSLAVYAQIVAGAWLRHGGGMDALALHLIIAVSVLVLVPLHARELGLASERLSRPAQNQFMGLRRWMIGALVAQVILGVGSLMVVSSPAGSLAGPGLGTAVVPTLHVVGGGILLMACVASWMWTKRVSHDQVEGSIVRPRQGAEGAGSPRWEAVQ
jgi:cytochrome c oxidase assembly protein subunit 15